MANINVQNWDDVLSEHKPLPVGKYLAILSNSEQLDDGKISLDFTIAEGPFKGKIVKKFLSFTSQAATEMASRIWATINKAVGAHTTDTASLHGKRLCIELGLSKDEKYNEIKAYSNASEWRPGDAAAIHSHPGHTATAAPITQPAQQTVSTQQSYTPW